MKRVLFTTAALAAFVVAAAVGTAEDEKVEKKAKDSEPTYVGADACKKCHFKQHRYWKKTGLMSAFDSLKPTPESEAELYAAKKKAKLDPTKDYRKDATCLPCHTTGYGKPGGYPVKPDESEASKALATSMEGVQCESCHGPGSKYVKHKTDTLAADENAKFTFEGMAKMGLIKPDKTNCATCHNDKNPAQPEKPFDFETAKGDVHSKKKKKK